MTTDSGIITMTIDEWKKIPISRKINIGGQRMLIPENGGTFAPVIIKKINKNLVNIKFN